MLQIQDTSCTIAVITASSCVIFLSNTSDMIYWPAFLFALTKRPTSQRLKLTLLTVQEMRQDSTQAKGTGYHRDIPVDVSKDYLSTKEIVSNIYKESV